MSRPLVAIVGRPNVGKSTLFNRVVGQPIAIVEDTPGTTRDRLYADAEWGGCEFTLIDTGGLALRPGSDLLRQVREQAQMAIAEADLVLFLVDAREGITPTDVELADLLRRSTKPVVIVANKADSEERWLNAVQFYQLGHDQVVPVSALHGTGTGDLLDLVVSHLPAQAPTEVEEAAALRVAIVGRPNVGKSSLLNAILGEERVIVDRAPGTTRDAIDTWAEIEGQPVMFIDTAGIRRRGHIGSGVERYGTIRALRAIQRADVVVLVLDAVEGITAQDSHLAGYAHQAAKGLILVVNKWDLAKAGHGVGQYTAQIREALKFAPYAPILFVSAKTGEKVDQVAPIALRIQAERTKRIATGPLNDFIRMAVLDHAPPSRQGRQLKVLYVTQATVNPPTFVFFVNDARSLHFSYQRYLENRLREVFGFEGTALKLVFRSRSEAASQR